MKRVLISGATGYIGSNLTRKLIALGYEVHIITRINSKTDKIKGLEKDINIHIFNGDSSSLIDIMSYVNPDVVIHLASLFIGEHTNEQLDGLINSNIYFPTQLIEASVKAGVKYFINTGTQWQNYEGLDYNPVNLYSATKEAFEVISKFYIESSDMRMITLKLADTYGPDDDRPKIMNLLLKVYKTQETLNMSKGEQEIGLVYINDVIKAFLKALNVVEKMKPHEHKKFIVLPKKIYSLKDMVCIFENTIGQKLNINWGKREYRQREMMKVYTGEENILDREETISLEEGIRMILLNDRK